jgi:aerotaxis receptor
MKINHPIQNIEAPYPKGQVLVSKTDTKGIINYANDAFIELSGFTKEELIGKNHNIVRHPDMPPEAFEDLWNTVKQGLPWKGIVKNRCKDGRYYWVAAFVVPIYKNGTTTGYMSVRSDPTREQVSTAETFYQRVKSDKVSFAHKVSTWDRVPLKTRFMGALGGIIFCLLLIGGLSAFIIEKMQTEYDLDSTQDEIELNLTKDVLMTAVAFKTQVQEWKNILIRGQDDAAYEKHLKAFTKQEEIVQSQLKALISRSISFGIKQDEIDTLILAHKELGDKYRVALKDFNRQSATGYQQVDVAVKGMDRSFASGIERLSTEILEGSAQHTKTAQALSRSNLSFNRTILVSANIFAFVIAGLMVWMLIDMMKTVRQMIAVLSEIAHGRLDNDIPTDRRDELGIVLASLASMQVSLRVMMDELRISVESIFSRLRILDRTAQDTRKQSNTQNDRIMEVSAAMEEVAVSVAEVAKNATQVLDAAQESLAVVNQGSASMNESLFVTDKAAQSVRASSEKINELNSAVQQISGATKVI